MSQRHTSVVILGGGPGGYEAALVAAQLGAAVPVVCRAGLGGVATLRRVTLAAFGPLSDRAPSRVTVSVEVS